MRRVQYPPVDYSPLAQFYYLQYQHYTDDLEFYTRLALDYGGPVLELGAGTGRVTRAIARQGLEVWALEPAQEMRKLGAKHTRGLGVKWLAGDMRSLELKRTPESPVFVLLAWRKLSQQRAKCAIIHDT